MVEEGGNYICGAWAGLIHISWAKKNTPMVPGNKYIK